MALWPGVGLVRRKVATQQWEQGMSFRHRQKEMTIQTLGQKWVIELSYEKSHTQIFQSGLDRLY